MAVERAWYGESEGPFCLALVCGCLGCETVCRLQARLEALAAVGWQGLVVATL